MGKVTNKRQNESGFFFDEAEQTTGNERKSAKEVSDAGLTLVTRVLSITRYKTKILKYIIATCNYSIDVKKNRHEEEFRLAFSVH